MLSSFTSFLRATSRLFSIISIVFITYAVIVTLFFYFTGSTNNASKTTSIIELNRQQIYKTLNDTELQTSKFGRQQLALYRDVNCGLLGEACTDNPADGELNFEKSFFGFLTNGVTMSYAYPPASGVYWTYAGLQNSGFIPKSYAAQGVGFAAIQPISGLWKSMRDAALILVVLILVTIGFLIMFRVKINAQTVVGVENALPRIFLSLMLIVFSFAISGFLIDLMYVITAIGVTIVEPSALKSILTGSTGKLFDSTFTNGNILGIGNAIFSILPTFLRISFRMVVGAAVFVLVTLLVPAIKKIAVEGAPAKEVPLWGGIGQTLIALGVSVALFTIIPPIVPFLLSLFILVTTGLVVFFRIIILLMGAYIRIILLVIFAPIILLLEAIPGKKMFSFWVKRLIADLATFPITAVLIVLSSKIADIRTQGGLWEPPFLTSAEPSAFPVLISVGLLFSIPNIIKKVKEFMGIKSSGLFSPGLFFVGAGGGAGGGGGVLAKYMDFRYKSQFLPKSVLDRFRKLPGFTSLGDSQNRNAGNAETATGSGGSKTH